MAIERQARLVIIVDSRKGRSELAKFRKSLGRADRDATKLKRKNKGLFKKTFGNITSESKKAGSAIRTNFGRLGGSFRELAANIAIVGGGLAGVASAASLIGTSIKDFARFEQAIRKVKAISQSTTEQEIILAEQAKLTAKTTIFTTEQTAGALLVLAQAGFDAIKSIGTLPNVLNLSAAAGGDLTRATELMVSTLANFNLGAAESERLADALVGAIGNSTANVQRFQLALRNAGPAASAYNQTLETTIGTLGLLTTQFGNGERAGVGFRALLRELPRRQRAMGLAVRDSTGKMKDFADLLRELEATGFSAQDAIFSFGNEAGPALAALLRQGSSELDRIIDSTKDHGRASRQAKDQMDTFQGSVTKMTSAFSVFRVELGSSIEASVGLRDIVDDLTIFINRLTDNVPSIQATLESFFGSFGTAGQQLDELLGETTTDVIDDLESNLSILAETFASNAIDVFSNLPQALGLSLLAVFTLIDLFWTDIFEVSKTALVLLGGTLAAIGSTILTSLASLLTGGLGLFDSLLKKIAGGLSAISIAAAVSGKVPSSITTELLEISIVLSNFESDTADFGRDLLDKVGENTKKALDLISGALQDSATAIRNQEKETGITMESISRSLAALGDLQEARSKELKTKADARKAALAAAQAAREEATAQDEVTLAARTLKIIIDGLEGSNNRWERSANRVSEALAQLGPLSKIASLDQEQLARAFELLRTVGGRWTDHLDTIKDKLNKVQARDNKRTRERNKAIQAIELQIEKLEGLDEITKKEIQDLKDLEIMLQRVKDGALATADAFGTLGNALSAGLGALASGGNILTAIGDAFSAPLIQAAQESAEILGQGFADALNPKNVTTFGDFFGSANFGENVGNLIAGGFVNFFQSQSNAAGIGSAIGSAIGTAILPGIGTAIGAIFGGLVGGLFAPNKDPRLTISNQLGLGGAQSRRTALGLTIQAGNQRGLEDSGIAQLLDGIVQFDRALADILSADQIGILRDAFLQTTDTFRDAGVDLAVILRQRLFDAVRALAPEFENFIRQIGEVEDGLRALAAIFQLQEFAEVTDLLIQSLNPDPVQALIGELGLMDFALQDATDAVNRALEIEDPEALIEASATLRQLEIDRYQTLIRAAREASAEVDRLTDAIADAARASRDFRSNIRQLIANIQIEGDSTFDLVPSNEFEGGAVAQIIFKDIEDLLTDIGNVDITNLDSIEDALDDLDTFVDNVMNWLAAANAAVNRWFEEVQTNSAFAQAEQRRLAGFTFLDIENAVAGINEKYDTQIAALKDAQAQAQLNAQAASKAAQRQKDALQSQIDLLQEQVKQAEAWRSVLDSTQDVLDRLTFSSTSPESGPGRLSNFTLEIDRLRMSLSTLEGEEKRDAAERIVDLLGQRLDLGQELFQRPSKEFQDLFNDTANINKEIRDIAATEVDKVEAFQMEIIALQLDANAINTSISSNAESFNARIQQLEADKAAALAIEDERRRVLDQALADERDKLLKENRDAAVGMLEWAKGKEHDLRKIQRKLLKEQRDIAQEQLDLITGGLPLAEFEAIAYTNMVASLKSIDAQIAAFLIAIQSSSAAVGGGRGGRGGGGGTGGGGGRGDPNTIDLPPGTTGPFIPPGTGKSTTINITLTGVTGKEEDLLETAKVVGKQLKEILEAAA